MDKHINELLWGKIKSDWILGALKKMQLFYILLCGHVLG